VVSSGADCTIRLWALAEPFNCIVKYLAPTSEGAFSCISAGEKIFVSGSENGMLRVWPLLSEDYQDLFTKAK
jgi:WD40 repeat protein